MKPKRRTAKERQEISKLLSDVLERAGKYEVTSYELNKVVDMSMPGLDKILKHTTKYPDLEILKEIDQYISSTYENTENANVAEPTEKYLTIKDVEIKDIYKKLQILEDKIDRCSLKQDIIFEILKNGKAAELNYITEMGSEKINSVLEQK